MRAVVPVFYKTNSEIRNEINAPVTAHRASQADRCRFGGTKPLRVFAALAAAKTGLDWRGEMGSSEEPQLWSFQVGRLGGGRHGVARDGMVSVKLVGVGGAWAIESDGN